MGLYLLNPYLLLCKRLTSSFLPFNFLEHCSVTSHSPKVLSSYNFLFDGIKAVFNKKLTNIIDYRSRNTSALFSTLPASDSYIHELNFVLSKLTL